MKNVRRSEEIVAVVYRGESYPCRVTDTVTNDLQIEYMANVREVNFISGPEITIYIGTPKGHQGCFTRANSGIKQTL